MNTLSALLLLSILLDKECPSRICSQAEQVEIARVVLHRAGSHNYESVRKEAFRKKQFSCFNDPRSKAETELIISIFDRSGKYPAKYEKYRLVVLRAAVLGPGVYSNYRLCAPGDTYSWSSVSWYTATGWHHCFSGPEDVGPYQGVKREDALIMKAKEEANNAERRKFWRLKFENEEDSGC